ncbi:N-acetyltransferase [Streptomyces bambusae]|uniref:GNAT family N-acetyltransferase n=1 Tax=Streptomyces bambusae TaxID=1550616 RepID=UPI001CFE2A6D|nr:N-acetyltransferase [Streptomyces bambusae]MCB5166129.1 N-acetyltransferase [Streptomyces bambusae]
MSSPFVPDDFTVPLNLVTPAFRLEPLGPEHNERDLAAWTGSIEYIRSLPDFAGRNWPPAEGMSAEANRADLVEHADDFAQRKGFTYSVIEGADEVIGCVYVYPARGGSHHADVRTWVRADRAELDGVLRSAVVAWLTDDWPLGPLKHSAG